MPSPVRRDDPMEQLALDLVSYASQRLRAGIDLDEAEATFGGDDVLGGPDFDARSSWDLFGSRRGRSPLFVAWDTNVPLDYLRWGGQLWRGGSLPGDLEESNYPALEALELILALSVVRDIRFVLFRHVVNDARRLLATDRRAERVRALEEFAAALTVADDLDGPASPSRDGLLDLPRSAIAAAIGRVPADFDRLLVRTAIEGGVHVFMTRDRGVLRCRDAVRPLGLLIADPESMLEYLAAAGAFHCLLSPGFATWPSPHPHRTRRLMEAIPGFAETVRSGTST
jgi:hypothetical protein